MGNGVILQYDVENPREGDVLTYRGGEWRSVPHALCFADEQSKIAELEAMIEALRGRIAVLEGHINTLAQATKENL